MTLFSGFLRYAGIFVLPLGMSAYSKRQQATESESYEVQGEQYQ